jgi:hypothetical protein
MHRTFMTSMTPMTSMTHSLAIVLTDPVRSEGSHS